MHIRIEESKTVRRASACIRTAGEIHVKVPWRWPAESKRRVAEELAEKLKRKDEREKRLLDNPAVRVQPRITLATPEELEAFVRLINAETFQLTLGKIAIGKARYHHLAQLNLSSKTMTVSAYCLKNAPLAALRYLIIHELAHYFESGHGPRFWRHVARYAPDYRIQSRIIKAFHHQAVIGEATPSTLSP